MKRLLVHSALTLLTGMAAPAAMAADVTLTTDASQVFTATGLDQFGQPMAAQPTVNWNTTVGSISPSNGPTTTLTAPGAAATGTLTASADAVTTSRSIAVTASGGGGSLQGYDDNGIVDPGSYVPASVAMGAPAPSGAIQLFDGAVDTQESIAEKWQSSPDPSNPIDWLVVEDPENPNLKALMSYGSRRYGVGDLATIQTFEDLEGHVEFVMMGDRDVAGPEGYSNSGVYAGGGGTEIQIESPPASDIDDPYNWDIGAHGVGGLIGIRGPDVNRWRPQGEWHVFHFVSRSGTQLAGRPNPKPRISVWWNGTLVHDNIEYDGRNGFRPLILQDHATDVRFRNIWVKPLPRNPDSEPDPDPTNNPPAIDEIIASPDPVIMTTTHLLASASDPEDNKLSYSWAVVSKPNGANPNFDSNAEDPQVTFDMAGSYTFRLTVSDGNTTVSADRTVSVNQSAYNIIISP